jgi:hypothetical protein
MPYANFNNQYYLQNLQDMKDRIENQIRNVQQNQIQQQVPQPITQNFQLAPQQNVNTSELESKYAENIDTVKNTIVAKTTLFLTKDYSTLWIKDVAGNVRIFRTDEIVEIDEKDKKILDLEKEIEELKGMVVNANDANNADVNVTTTTKKSTRTSSTTKSNEK